MELALDGRVALVTGAARGIGLAIAAALVQHGASAVLADIDARGLREAARELGERTTAVDADVSRSGDVRRAVETAVGRYGALDILVNNAGICPLTPFDEIAEEEWDLVMAVNVKGAFLCCQAGLDRRHQIVGPPAGIRWGHRELRRACHYRVRPHCCLARGAPDPGAQPDPSGPLRHSCRDRRGGLFPGRRRRQLHHRRDAGCERGTVPAVDDYGPRTRDNGGAVRSQRSVVGFATAKRLDNGVRSNMAG
jgi:hypothetical protein